MVTTWPKNFPGLGTGALTLNGFNQLNPLGNVDRVAATGDKIQLQTSTDSNVGSGVTFKDFGEYANDFIVFDGTDGSSYCKTQCHAGTSIVKPNQAKPGKSTQERVWACLRTAPPQRPQD